LSACCIYAKTKNENQTGQQGLKKNQLSEIHGLKGKE
jgi:hypothetical protein